MLIALWNIYSYVYAQIINRPHVALHILFLGYLYYYMIKKNFYLHCCYIFTSLDAIIW